MDQPYKYYLASAPLNGNLYVTDPIKRQILQVKSFENVDSLKKNFRVSNGYCSASESGGECEYANAPTRQLRYPKGIAFDNNGIMYFIDENRVKSINTDGQITTVLGVGANLDESSTIMYKPSRNCNQTYTLDSSPALYWPTVLAVNPVDNNLYILDNDVVYKLTAYNTIEIVAGVPYGCAALETTSYFVKLYNPIDMAFGPDGDLFVLENDQANGVKQIRIIKSNGEVDVFFGAESNVDRKSSVVYSMFDVDSNNFNGFNDPISIAVHQNKSVYVLDRGDNVLYHIKNSIAKDDFYGKYTVISPETKEAYIFNRFGLHLHTVDLIGGGMLYNFSYNGNAYYGKLTTITDQNKLILSIKRDFHGRAELIQTANSYTIKVLNKKKTSQLYGS